MVSQKNVLVLTMQMENPSLKFTWDMLQSISIESDKEKSISGMCSPANATQRPTLATVLNAVKDDNGSEKTQHV
jgi:hypothetical protein